VLGTPDGDRGDAAREWQAAERAAQPPRLLGWFLGAAWAAVGGADARVGGGRLSGRRWAWRLCGARAPPRGHARGRHVRRSPAAAIPLVCIYRIGGLVLHCTWLYWLVGCAGQFPLGELGPRNGFRPLRTKGNDGGRHRRRREVNRAFCLVPLAAPLPGSGDPIGGTFLGRQRWDTSLLGTVAAGLCYRQHAHCQPVHCNTRASMLTMALACCPVEHDC